MLGTARRCPVQDEDEIDGDEPETMAEGHGGRWPSDEAVAELVRSRGRKGLTTTQLVAHALDQGGGSRSDVRRAMRQALNRLERAGRVVVGRGKRYYAPEASDQASGRLRVAAGGRVMVDLDGVAGAPVSIPPRRTRGALDGDRVLIRLERPRSRAREQNLREGVVVRILDRARRSVVGRWVVEHGRREVRPLDKRLNVTVLPSVPGGMDEPAEGDLVVVSLDEVDEHGNVAHGALLERLGRIGDPGVEERVAIRMYNLEEEFAPEVLAEAERLPRTVRAKDLAGRLDLRAEPAITIDGETARDFDDAVSAKRGSHGAITVDVHIADVSHYVRPNSLVGDTAKQRGTSVYLPGRCLPMLPERLSNELCSLRPEEDRLTVTVRFTVRPDGELRHPELHVSVIRSVRRCTYTEVFGWLSSPVDAWPETTRPFAASLRCLAEAADRLRQARQARGGLDLDLAEPDVRLDAEGRVVEVRAGSRNQAHRLIEELMVAANTVVARLLTERGLPALYRVHDRPDRGRLEELGVVLAELGHPFSADPGTADAGDLQRLLDRVSGQPEERLVATLILRSLARAIYSPEPRGHFALATDDYLHFTSPIRRYPDLVCHRAVKVLLGEESREALPAGGELNELARATSASERRAESAERMVVLWKTLTWLSSRLGDELDGVITGVTSFGLFVQLDEVFVDGMIHIADLGDDYYIHDERRHQLVGEHTGRRFRLGDRVRTRLARVDLEALQVGLVPASATARSADGRPAGDRRRGPRDGGGRGRGGSGGGGKGRGKRRRRL